MTIRNEFDDEFGGEGLPSNDQIIKTRDYLKRHNRKASIRSTTVELIARGFTISVPTVGRALRGRPGGNPSNRGMEKKSPHEKRVAHRRDAKPKSLAKAVLTKEDIDALPDGVELSSMAALLVEENTSTELAIRENRSRMALNIVIAERMAATPGLLLIDMRGTAALVDALTIAAKLSGGASIDIKIPSGGGQPDHSNGHDANGLDENGMRDVTPQKTSLTADLEAFRRRRNGDGSRT